MTDKQPQITVDQVVNAIHVTRNTIEVKTIQYEDTRRRINNPSTSLSRQAELITKEKTLASDIATLMQNLEILQKAYNDHLATKGHGDAGTT